MITKTNFKSVLEALEFKESGSFFEKRFDMFNCTMAVDFSTEKLIYPVEIKGRERNDDFDQPENFVVFECVTQLLKKGYRPEDIELEKEWHLGHDAKSGRADICVTYNDEMLFIVECKTAGREFEKAYKDTQRDGGQLFSYWQQERATKWLMLYASDFIAGSIVRKAPTINCSDDKNIEQLAKTDPDIKLYRNAFTAEQKYFVWKDTYSSHFFDNLIFHRDTKAYEIGIRPLFKKDLRDFAPEDKIVNRFEEILRHNNVSDKENAFNRLVALFICKLVDEITKDEDDIVEFQYMQGTDTYESLQDRLQKLHTQGMEKFMREKIYYVPNDYPEQLFATYTGHQRKQAIEDLRNTIRILKFYSNNDFSFKDVHNEELFYQNGKILVEIVQLFEPYRIVYPSKHQFLGDLFEQLLSKGFKQNEGQFFTPMPITRFIWDSLPIQDAIHTEQGFSYPKVIDYACGAGHFLTEAVEAINTFANADGNNSWVRDHIFGIEKDYRLARVSKISMFMNGAGEANIVFGDGLENQVDKGIDNGAFDILVANPPYAVKDFKQHLQLKNNTFELLSSIGDNGSEIEVLFVERIAQLLKPNGIAAVILPSSILSNDSASYTGAREQILQNFKVRSIVQFGNKTFGATGTNTVVLFLEKYAEPPKRKDLVIDSVYAILSGEALDDWEDKAIFDGYTEQIDVVPDTYISFAKEKMSLSDLSQIEHFKVYVDAFLSSGELVKLRKQKAFMKLPEADQAEQIKHRFYAFSKAIEKEKIFYFALTYSQNTLIVTAPSDNAKQKEFLGYDWSNRKGAEGIQILSPGGKLYDDANRTAEGTLASAIRQVYANTVPELSEENSTYACVVRTADMLTYSRLNFNKAIRASSEKKIVLTSKYPLDKIDNLKVLLMRGKSPTYGDSSVQVIKSGQARGFHDFDFTKKAYLSSSVELDERKLQKGDILINSTGVGTAGRVTAFNLDGDYVVDSHITIFRPNERILSEFALLVLSVSIGFKTLEKMADGSSGQIELAIDTIKNIKLPVPPIPVQQQIVDQCDNIDAEYVAINKNIKNYHQEIKKIFDGLDAVKNATGTRFSLSDNTKFDVSIGKRILNSELVAGADIPVFSANVFEPFGYIDKLLIKDFSRDSILWGIDGDWMVNFYEKEQPFYPTDHCGVLRVLTNEVNPRYLAHILDTEGEKMNFSRSYRASIDRIEGIIFTVPAIEAQNEAMQKVRELEQKIAEMETALFDIIAKKEAILQEHLQ